MKIIQAGRYGNGNLAYWVEYDDGEDLPEVVSVNLGKVPEAVPNAWFFDVNNYQEEYEILLDSGAIRFTGLQRQSGFVSYPLVVRAEDDRTHDHVEVHAVLHTITEAQYLAAQGQSVVGDGDWLAKLRGALKELAETEKEQGA